MKHFFMWSAFFLMLNLAGCTHIMSQAGLALADHSIAYTDIKRNPEALVGKNVLVGGVIAVTLSSGDVMQLEVAQLELLENGLPDEYSSSAGRFLVVSGELFDPLFYSPGSLVTVIGEIKGQKIQKLEGVEYRYPLISAKEIRLFRPPDSSKSHLGNPYQNQVGDRRFMLRPPAVVVEDPSKPF